MTVRLTKQRWDALLSAMNYYETVIRDGEMTMGDDAGDYDWRAERRHHESAMVWLLSVRPKEVTR